MPLEDDMERVGSRRESKFFEDVERALLSGARTANECVPRDLAVHDDPQSVRDEAPGADLLAPHVNRLFRQLTRTRLAALFRPHAAHPPGEPDHAVVRCRVAVRDP